MPCPAPAGGAAGEGGGKLRFELRKEREEPHWALRRNNGERQGTERKPDGKKPRSPLLFPEMDSPSRRDAPGGATPLSESANYRRGGWNYEWAVTHVTRRRLKGPRLPGDPAGTLGGTTGTLRPRDASCGPDTPEERLPQPPEASPTLPARSRFTPAPPNPAPEPQRTFNKRQPSFLN